MVFHFPPAYSTDDLADLLKKRERFAIACAGIYEYQHLTGGFDATLLMYKREMMGQLVYNNIASSHYEDMVYFEDQVKRANADLISMPDEHKKTYQHDQWVMNPALCDEMAAIAFTLISAKEWSEGSDKELSTAKAIIRDIYPWKNETSDKMLKDLEDQYQYAMKNKVVEKP